ncbi:hypothetical protein RND81_01G098700, partial [Saponaria officinalis]
LEAQEAVLQGGFLLFDNKPLIVKAWSLETKLAKEKVNTVPVWIRLVDLDLQFWGKKCLERLAGEVGKFVRCDLYTEERIHVAYARILVEFAMDQPVVKTVKFLDEMDNLCEVTVEHQWLPVMCTTCNGFGHGLDMCKRKKGVQVGAQVWTGKVVQSGHVVQPVQPPPPMPGATGSVSVGEGVRQHVLNSPGTPSVLMANFGLWNVRGLNSSIKQKEIKWFLYNNKVELFGLLEPKFRSRGVNKLVEVIGNASSFCTYHSCNEMGRVWVVWNPRVFQVKEIECTDQCIHLRVVLCNGGRSFWVSMVYGFNTAGERWELWENLCRMKNKITGPWVWCGDFNSVLNPNERFGQPVTMAEIRGFRGCVNWCGMTDIKATGAFFTWNNKQVAENRVFCRLDRVMHNVEWGMDFSEAYAQFLPEGLFDHCPYIISLMGVVGRRSTLFKYFNMWITAPEFGATVRQG